MIFKDRFKFLRKQAHLTQVQLAEKLSLSRSTVAMYELGQREPDFETLFFIADFFNVNVAYLLGAVDTRDVSYIADKTICSNYPINFLKAQYDIPSDIFSRLFNLSRDDVDKLLFNNLSISDEVYIAVAKFFEIDLNMLKNGKIPLYPSADVYRKVLNLKNERYSYEPDTSQVVDDILSISSTKNPHSRRPASQVAYGGKANKSGRRKRKPTL